MNAGLPAPGTRPHLGLRFRWSVPRALARLTWRALGVVLVIAVAFEGWVLVEMADIYPSMSRTQSYLSGTIVTFAMAFSIMLCTLIADEMVALGSGQIPAYAVAVIAGSAIGTIVQWQAHRWLLVVPVVIDAPSSNPLYDFSGNMSRPDILATQPAAMFFEFLIWGSIVVFIYVKRRNALLADKRMDAARAQRAGAQRRTLESRLQALQARVEPLFLFNTLAEVRDLYDVDPALGGRMLGDLIAYLRAALPHFRESTSTVGREVGLAAAYLRIKRARFGSRFDFSIDVPPAAFSARMPAMILLPLIDRLLVDGVTASSAENGLRIGARSDESSLRVELAFEGRRVDAGETSGLLHDVRGRLRELYGAGGRLDVEAWGRNCTRLVMEIPYEAADRDHR